MTHDTSCSVRDEYRDEVQEIAEWFWEGKTHAATQRAEELGWNFIGGGAGRRVFRVSGEQQIGDVEQATDEAPCVVKFASGRGSYDGKSQNRDEIQQFKRLPAELTEPEAGVPAFVPVKDWGDDYLWLSMPEVDPRGGSPGEAATRLKENGWECDDMHGDNVGDMHGEPVVLDYGLECREVDLPGEYAEGVADYINRHTEARNVELEELAAGFAVHFDPPRGVIEVESDDTDSRVGINTKGQLVNIIAEFGDYDKDRYSRIIEQELTTIADTDIPTLGEAGARIGDELEREWLDFFADSSVHAAGAVGYLEVKLDNVHPNEVPADIVGNVLEDMFSYAHKHLPGGGQYPASDEDIEAAMGPAGRAEEDDQQAALGDFSDREALTDELSKQITADVAEEEIERAVTDALEQAND